MNKMILYKEWLKTRWALLGIVAVFGALTFYCFLNLGKVVEIKGAELLWEALVTKDTVLTELLRYLPALAGAALALAQYVPEVQHKRLKLTLHLPYPQGRMLLGMTAFGLGSLLLLYLVHAVVCAGLLGTWVPGELVSRMLRTMCPWYLSGWASYLFMCAVCLEPTWRFRVLELLVAASFLRILYLSPVPEAYNAFLLPLFVYVVAAISLVFLSVARFKEGYQD